MNFFCCHRLTLVRVDRLTHNLNTMDCEAIGQIKARNCAVDSVSIQKSWNWFPTQEWGDSKSITSHAMIPSKARHLTTRPFEHYSPGRIDYLSESMKETNSNFYKSSQRDLNLGYKYRNSSAVKTGLYDNKNICLPQRQKRWYLMELGSAPQVGTNSGCVQYIRCISAPSKPGQVGKQVFVSVVIRLFGLS